MSIDVEVWSTCFEDVLGPGLLVAEVHDRLALDALI